MLRGGERAGPVVVGQQSGKGVEGNPVARQAVVEVHQGRVDLATDLEPERPDNPVGGMAMPAPVEGLDGGFFSREGWQEGLVGTGALSDPLPDEESDTDWDIARMELALALGVYVGTHRSGDRSRDRRRVGPAW